jgi:hypothetical protein
MVLYAMVGFRPSMNAAATSFGVLLDAIDAPPFIVIAICPTVRSRESNPERGTSCVLPPASLPTLLSVVIVVTAQTLRLGAWLGLRAPVCSSVYSPYCAALRLLPPESSSAPGICWGLPVEYPFRVGVSGTYVDYQSGRLVSTPCTYSMVLYVEEEFS